MHAQMWRYQPTKNAVCSTFPSRNRSAVPPASPAPVNPFAPAPKCRRVGRMFAVNQHHTLRSTTHTHINTASVRRCDPAAPPPNNPPIRRARTTATTPLTYYIFARGRGTPDTELLLLNKVGMVFVFVIYFFVRFFCFTSVFSLICLRLHRVLVS